MNSNPNFVLVKRNLFSQHLKWTQFSDDSDFCNFRTKYPLFVFISSKFCSRQIKLSHGKVSGSARANQLKKARDDFFFGNQENEAANTSRPQSLAVNTEGMAGNILDSPSSDMDVSSSSNVQRQIIKFGGSTGGGGGGSGSRRSSRAFSGRHSFTEPEQEDIEATGFPAPPAVEVAEEDKREKQEKREKLISPPLSPKSRERKTGAIPKVLNKK